MEHTQLEPEVEPEVNINNVNEPEVESYFEPEVDKVAYIRT